MEGAATERRCVNEVACEGHDPCERSSRQPGAHQQPFMRELPTSRYCSPVTPVAKGTWLVGAGLVAVQLPFVLTHHIQEAAYITFPSAVNRPDPRASAF